MVVGLRCTSLFFVSVVRPPQPTLFPYTTLFRSSPATSSGSATGTTSRSTSAVAESWRHPTPGRSCGSARSAPTRSEEHTSELQSHVNLVCRLLLEKKNHLTQPQSHIEYPIRQLA